MFQTFDEFFVPGTRHLTEERNRLELTREDAGTGDPCRGPVDLGSGLVLVRRAEEPHEGPPEPEDTEGTGIPGP
ncbi:hypothetical protein I3J09_06790 [Streptomyces clavuligerus]|nr:DUF6191 domain-containing protein [Streptomyces clavuligerus]ANW17935.1 hypothetical protein BB341_06735 [Streptomyces clavuligerus]AXU12491.1 hypothetical protein D1794_06990 [Streptomyces clavuligerus]MBY6302385.1 hypothetical protein [Streptomyces clavuligerus]QCS05273.1 hypothetical protein CRV15_06410 [Streptomyces clavuligerus]QPJ95357.1 hypothetical protein GE265_21510 [Streptomyces clavuligerus]